MTNGSYSLFRQILRILLAILRLILLIAKILKEFR